MPFIHSTLKRVRHAPLPHCFMVLLLLLPLLLWVVMVVPPHHFVWAPFSQTCGRKERPQAIPMNVMKCHRRRTTTTKKKKGEGGRVVVGGGVRRTTRRTAKISIPFSPPRVGKAKEVPPGIMTRARARGIRWPPKWFHASPTPHTTYDRQGVPQKHPPPLKPPPYHHRWGHRHRQGRSRFGRDCQGNDRA